MKLRKAKERGYFKNEWLESYHTFSFADYFDRHHMNYSDLRVINHDFIQAGTGFPTHPHRDIEIVTYILDGVVEHQDSMGNKTQIKSGEIQVMGAGTGILHSEYNPSTDKVLELLQIWILPSKKNLKPKYFQKNIRQHDNLNKLTRVVEANKDIHQDCSILSAVVDEKNSINYSTLSEKCYWLQIAKGAFELVSSSQNLKLEKGDGLSFEAEELKLLDLKSLNHKSEFLLFELKKERS